IAARGIQWRIALSYVTLLGLVMLALGVYLVRFLHEAEFRNLEAQLAREAHMVATDAVYRLSTGGPDSLDPFAKQIGDVAELRVTLIGLDGRVLGDSDA